MLKWLRQNPFWWPWLFLFAALFFAYAMYQLGINPAEVAHFAEEKLAPVAAFLMVIGGTVFFFGLFFRK